MVDSVDLWKEFEQKAFTPGSAADFRSRQRESGEWALKGMGDVMGAKTSTWIDDARAQISGKKGVYETGMDNVTANMLVKIHDALSPDQQAKLAGLPLEKAVDVGWRLVK
jgi:hypothetical protein